VGLHWNSAGLVLSSWKIRWSGSRLLLLLLVGYFRLGLSLASSRLGRLLVSGGLLFLASWTLVA
jgi:hypothetical protein